MRLLWKRASDKQLDLPGVDAPVPAALRTDGQARSNPDCAVNVLPASSQTASAIVPANGQPLMVPVTCLDEDANNPRTQFADAELEELAEDIRQHGILEAIVVHPADAQGRYRIHFGAMRMRAAQRAGLREVPVVVRDAPGRTRTRRSPKTRSATA
jgi:phytoene dehydrogenase-like protein